MIGRPYSPRRRLEYWKRTAVWPMLMPATRLVLDAAVNFGNGTGLLYPSQRTLAADCRCHRSTVERALAQATVVGILVRLQQIRPKGRRGPGCWIYELAPPPRSEKATEEAARVARSVRGREGMRRLMRRRIARNVAANCRDEATGRFTAELAATVRTIQLPATRRPDPYVFPPEGKPEGKPDGSVRRVGAGAPRPPRSATPPGPSQGDGLVGEKGDRPHPPGLGWVAPMSEKAYTRTAGKSPVSRKELTHIEAILPAVVPGTPDGASKGGRVPQGPAPSPGSGAPGNGRPGGPDLAADADRLLESVLEPASPPGMRGIPRSTVRVVQEPETEEEAREVARQMVVLRDYLSGYPSPPTEFHVQRLVTEKHFRRELIEAVVRELHGRGGGGSG